VKTLLRKVLVILVIIPVLGTTIIGCDSGGGDGYIPSSPESIPIPIPEPIPGKLNISGIISLNSYGKADVAVFNKNTDINEIITQGGSLFKNSEVVGSTDGKSYTTFNLYKYYGHYYDTWKESGEWKVLFIGDTYRVALVNFTNGSANVPFSDFIPVK